MTSQPRFFASLWSLREYPDAKNEWSWPRKLAAIREAGFDGLMAPPAADLRQRGGLAYLAITSITRTDQVVPVLDSAAELGAVGMVVQLGRHDTALSSCLELAQALFEGGQARNLPVSIETHRATFTETPENTHALAGAFHERTGEPLPVCYDFSHFAVVRHLAAPYWPVLAQRRDLIARARVFHVRPFTGHHCQIPAVFPDGTRTPEYLTWLDFVRELFGFIQAEGQAAPILVPEIGHAAPSYRLSCFPDTWHDTRITHEDLRELWDSVQQGRPALQPPLGNPDPTGSRKTT